MQYQCRFCLEDDTEQNLISPCLCIGTGRYVHAKCMFQWYTYSPSKGSVCQVCKSQLATRKSYGPEKHAFEGIQYWKWIQCPSMFIILVQYICNYIRAFFNINFRMETPQLNTMSIYSQCIYHVYMIWMMYLCISIVYSRRAYWAYWYRTSRMAIPLAHCFFLVALSIQKGLSELAGLSADICLMYYVMEHTQILNHMNRRSRIEFISMVPQEQ